MIKISKFLLIFLISLFIMLTVSASKFAYDNIDCHKENSEKILLVSAVNGENKVEINVDETMIPKPEKGFLAKYWDYILGAALVLLSSLGIGVKIGRKRERMGK